MKIYFKGLFYFLFIFLFIFLFLILFLILFFFRVLPRFQQSFKKLRCLDVAGLTFRALPH